MPKPAHELESIIGYSFKDQSLLILALTHPSIGSESPEYNNQRLEFLGDAVLGLVLTAAIYQRHSVSPEGLMSKARARMVSHRALSKKAAQLHLGDYLTLSRAEEKTGGRHRASNLEDAFEALLGAVYLDGGISAAQSVILGLYSDELEEPLTEIDLTNSKGELQERIQKRFGRTQTYEIVQATGPDHQKTFQCVVRFNGIELGMGKDASKRSAEAQAATSAIQNLTNGKVTLP